MPGISVSVTVGADQASSKVQASGSVQHVITDQERSSFGIQDGPLKAAVGKFFGKNPNDAYVCSPTPWDDLYKTYNWPQVQTVLTVQEATIVGITSEPVIVATKTFVNNSSKKATFNASVSDQVSNTTTSSWSNSDTIQVGQKISYEYKFPGGSGIGGETSLSYSHTWGQGGSESKTFTVGSTQGISIDLDPGESVESVLTASRGVMKVRLVYVASLSGDVAVNYNPTFKDHHFWALNVGGVMQAGGIANSLKITEDIEIGYFSNAKSELRDAQGKLKAAVAAPMVLTA